jgi:hypothetical protein
MHDKKCILLCYCSFWWYRSFIGISFVGVASTLQQLLLQMSTMSGFSSGCCRQATFTTSSTGGICGTFNCKTTTCVHTLRNSTRNSAGQQPTESRMYASPKALAPFSAPIYQPQSSRQQEHRSTNKLLLFCMDEFCENGVHLPGNLSRDTP